MNFETVGEIEAYIKPRIDCYTNFKKDVNFMDISSILGDPELDELTEKGLKLLLPRDEKGYAYDAVVGFDARGFFYMRALAKMVNGPSIMARKHGKMPGELHSKTYTKEYGDDMLTIQKKRIIPGLRYMIHDDLLATGGTADAAYEIITDLGGIVTGYNFIMEIVGMGGREKLAKHIPNENICSLIHL